jgi:hypothetical protein
VFSYEGERVRRCRIVTGDRSTLSFRNADVLGRLSAFRAAAANLSFVLLDPWAIHSRRGPRIVEMLREQGFRLLDFRYLRLTDTDLEQLYRKEDPVNFDPAAGWELFKEARTIGTSCGLLLHSSQPEPGLALKKIKGKAFVPVEGLRYRLRAFNNTIDYLHSSDDEPSTLYEAPVVFSPAALEASLAVSADVAAMDAERRFHSDAYLGSERIVEQPATTLLVRLRLRIAAILAAETGVAPDIELMRLWNHHVAKDFLSCPVADETATYLSLLERERPHVDCYLRRVQASAGEGWYPRIYVASPDVRGLLVALETLTRPERYATADHNALVRYAPVFIDRWEEILFKTTLYHFEEQATLARELPSEQHDERHEVATSLDGR